MLVEAHQPAIHGDISTLPMADRAVDGAAAINCLYFLVDPQTALREAWRVLRPGGLLVASTPTRWNDPELAGIDPNWGTPSSFDSEHAPALVGEVFGDVEVLEWIIAACVLPDRQVIADYLHAFNIPDWETKASEIQPPVTITKVAAEVWARR
jgi:SAM-dependent methyltransferase